MKIKKLEENVNQTERPVITIPSPFNKIYFIVDDLGDEELEGFKPEGIQYSDVEFIAPIRAKAKYNDVLSDNGMEWLGLYSNGGNLFIGQVVAGRLYNVEDDILDEVANYIKEPKNESLPEPMKTKVVESTRGQAHSNRYNTYKKRIEKAIAKNDTETLARVKEAVMYAPAKELKNSEAEELMTMIKNAKLKESKSIKESFDTNKTAKLWELMRDVDSLEDIYETSEGYYVFVFESPGNIDKRVEQIRKGLDKEGYKNSFEKTFSSEIIVFDIDFEDDLEEGIDYKPKFISDKSIEELQNELNQMYADQYKYGRSIDRPRMWDINYTIKQLKKGLEEDLENSEEKEIPPAPKGDNTGIANLINALIKDEWDAIDGYQTAIATLRSLDDYNESAILVLQEIANDEYSHIGNLQKILDKFAPQVSTIADGAKEAEETIANNNE